MRTAEVANAMLPRLPKEKRLLLEYMVI